MRRLKNLEQVLLRRSNRGQHSLSNSDSRSRGHSSQSPSFVHVTVFNLTQHTFPSSLSFTSFKLFQRFLGCSFTHSLPSPAATLRKISLSLSHSPCFFYSSTVSRCSLSIYTSLLALHPIFLLLHILLPSYTSPLLFLFFTTHVFLS